MKLFTAFQINCFDGIAIWNKVEYFFVIRLSGCNGKTRIDVILLSADDGRRSLVHTARKLSSAVTNLQLKCKDIVPASLDAILQGNCLLLMTIEPFWWHLPSDYLVEKLAEYTHFQNLTFVVDELTVLYCFCLFNRRKWFSWSRLSAEVWYYRKFVWVFTLASEIIRNTVSILKHPLAIMLSLDMWLVGETTYGS